MKKETDILAQDIEIPDIVNKKMQEAFDIIKSKESTSMNNISKINNKQIRSIKILKNQAAAIICMCILALGGITAYAAYNYFWSRGMKGTLQATDVQQYELSENGIATIYQESNNYMDMAVTNGEITVMPEMMVVNEKMIYLSLSVEGYDLQEGEEPCFEFIDVYLGDDFESEENCLNMGAKFYNGIVLDENGNNVYEDGTKLRTDENGKLAEYYIDEEGKMEFIIIAMVSEPEKSLLGETLHVELTNLGTVYKAEFSEDIQGEWNYTFDISDTSLTDIVRIQTEIQDTIFMLESIEISPVSIKLNYDVNGEVSNIYEDINGVPGFCGVVLKDGKRLPYLSNGRMSGYTDNTFDKAYCVSAFNQVIEPEQIAAIILRTEDDGELLEISLDR